MEIARVGEGEMYPRGLSYKWFAFDDSWFFTAALMVGPWLLKLRAERRDGGSIDLSKRLHRITT